MLMNRIHALSSTFGRRCTRENSPTVTLQIFSPFVLRRSNFNSFTSPHPEWYHSPIPAQLFFACFDALVLFGPSLNIFCHHRTVQDTPRPRQSAMVSFMHYWALQEFVAAAEYLGRFDDVKKYSTMAERVREACEKELWDGEW